MVEINLKDSRNFIINLLKKEKLKEFLEILDNFSTPIQTLLYFRHAFFEYDKYEKELRDNANISYQKYINRVGIYIISTTNLNDKKSI